MKRLLLLLMGVLLSRTGFGCELCAIYSASSARGESKSGFTFNLTEQYVSQNTLQQQGDELHLPPLNSAYLHTSWTHFVPGYNFNPRLGVNVSIPYIYRDFRRVEFPSTGGVVDEKGNEQGLGDVSLIARFAPFVKVEMNYSILFNVMAGVKFPTGDTDRLDAEVARARQDELLFGPGHNHSAQGGIHLHDLTLGSGSYDGIFGTALTARWKKFYFNQQLQYYLRTEARGYRYADMFIASGGPGMYLITSPSWTASLQGNVYYETSGSDDLIGQKNIHTGMAAWYAGPQLNLTLGEHLSLNVAAELPLHYFNRGIQTVVDFRIHGGLTWSF
ncbi:MAG TPA: hypothetical protein VK850_12695 [Candidatus Binatia bacterium]|nr:hypothetical protein [Candidatus Binatia bacterium]